MSITQAKETINNKKIKNLFSKKNFIVNEEYVDSPITIKNLTKRFRKFTAVDNIDITVKKGSIHGFIGPNGSGKTTTIKSLVSSIIPTKGEIYIFGRKAFTVDAKKHVGYIPENARFPRKISAVSYITSMAQISGLKRKEAKTKAEEILNSLNLEKFKHKSPNTFSSGMKKKVLLAQALISNPDLLILDEPAANLDPTARTELFNELKKCRDEGKTIFISSHILAELEEIADSYTILKSGKVVFEGSLKAESNIYEFDTSDNEKLCSLLREQEIEFNIHDNHILVTIPQSSEVDSIISLISKNKLTIKLFKPYVKDLQTLYENIVMESNKKN